MLTKKIQKIVNVRDRSTIHFPLAKGPSPFCLKLKAHAVAILAQDGRANELRLNDHVSSLLRFLRLPVGVAAVAAGDCALVRLRHLGHGRPEGSYSQGSLSCRRKRPPQLGDAGTAGFPDRGNGEGLGHWVCRCNHVRLFSASLLAATTLVCSSFGEVSGPICTQEKSPAHFASRNPDRIKQDIYELYVIFYRRLVENSVAGSERALDLCIRRHGARS